MHANAQNLVYMASLKSIITRIHLIYRYSGINCKSTRSDRLRSERGMTTTHYTV